MTVTAVLVEHPLVLSHVVPGDGSVPDSDWHDAAKRCFHGQVVVGHDLMEL